MLLYHGGVYDLFVVLIARGNVAYHLLVVGGSGARGT
jgi:hypothetical protein